ncbi:PglD-related sugar-binding protein [Sutcliffiella halmapala]|uniref:PglD-related sugar-binding protein n=1 Tax=Sutcliffiella halmapala TaxID=79882 RepID=UPI000994935E|nr:hypothetical protein [Sutcliffiella halmapala]
MNKNLLIFGAGGHGRVVKETATAMEYFDKVDFLDDNSELAIGKCQDFNNYLQDYSYAFVAFGNNEQRMKWALQLIQAGFQLPVLIHPVAYVSPLAKIEMGSIVCAKAVVNTNSTIEKCCIVSIGALVDHDSYIGEGTHINSGAIVKAGSSVERLKKVDAGMVYSNETKLKEYSFEVGV